MKTVDGTALKMDKSKQKLILSPAEKQQFDIVRYRTRYK